MKFHLMTVSALLASTTVAHAVGLDRVGRPTAFIFESGNQAEFSLGFANPSIDGTDLTTSRTGNIADNFTILGAGLRYEVNDKLSFGLIVDEPYGADILYGAGSPLLAGTEATLDSTAATFFARYKVNENVAIHGGLIYQNISASVTLAGAAYDGVGLNGYRANFASDDAFGYMLGASYEIPEIALRVALTYHSEIDHAFDTAQSINGFAVAPITTTEVTTPESIRLDFQSGVAEDTLVFGHIRFSHYSQTQTQTSLLGGASLTDLENALDISLGVGRRFNDKWSGSLTIGWEERGEDDLVSPLSSTNGAVFAAVGASYQATDQIKISGGIRYTDFYDANPSIGGTSVGTFENNSALSAGLRVQFSF